MTDINNMFMPSEILFSIGGYLTIPQLARFKQVCRLFNDIGSDVNFLQPLYFRLYRLDESLPALLPQQGAALEFKHAFEKIKSRQNQEIFFLDGSYRKGYRNIVDALLAIPGKTLEQLEKRDALLTHLNSEIIQENINQHPGVRLNLTNPITRFIMTEDNAEYFKNLTRLDCDSKLLTTLNLKGLAKLQHLFCSSNVLALLNLQGCVALKTLSCKDNQLSSLKLQGLAALQVLDCSQNPLTKLNLQGCTALQDLFCCHTKLTTLTLQGCAMLRRVYCEHNALLTTLDLQDCVALQDIFCSYNYQLNSINVQGCTALQELNCNNNLLLTTLNLQNLAAVEWLNCDNNTLTALNLEGTSQAFQLRHASLIEEVKLHVKKLSETVESSESADMICLENQSTSFLPSFSVVTGEIENPAQRKKIKPDNDEKNESSENKKTKPND